MTDKVVLDPLDHYERLIDEGLDPFHDALTMQGYMRRWDGPPFFEALGNLSHKDVLEIGVGTGRIAAQVLDRGCRHLTGIDFSPKTVERAKENLAKYQNVDLLVTAVTTFVRPSAFDIAYSVLTFMHITSKAQALENIVHSLRPGGRITLSVAEEGQWLDFGSWKVRLHYAPPRQYIDWLNRLGCKVEKPVDLLDRWVSPHGKKEKTYGKKIATLIQATKMGE